MADIKPNERHTSRIPYIDVMKGILIIMVAFGHLLYAMEKYGNLSLTHRVYEVTSFVANTFVAPYYMAAFFCITGFCSNFNKPLAKQLKDDFRRLVVPGIIISLFMILVTTQPDLWLNRVFEFITGLNFPWFVMGLFIAKFFIWILLYIVDHNILRLLILCGMSAFGCFMIGKHPSLNILSVFHAFAFAVFVYLGHWVKVSSQTFLTTRIYINGLIFVILSSLLAVFDYPIPALCSNVTFGLKSWPLYLILATTGTLGILCLSKKIGQNCILEYLGRNSLVIYLTHFAFLMIASRFIDLLSLDINGNTVIAISIVFGMLIGSILWSLFWVQILNMRGMRWIIGKN